jgi:hypothetical protein
VNQALEIGETDRQAREGLSAFSGLVVLCILVGPVAATTFIASGGSAQTPHQYSAPPPAFRSDLAPDESTTIYLPLRL